MAIQPLAPGTGLYETRTEPGYRFEILRVLGQGGFGITYLARDLELHGVCVIKEFALGEIAARATMNETIVALAGRETDFNAWLDRFERESRQIHRISHPNVVRVRAAWKERGTAYYAMDLVEGNGELPSPDEENWRPMPWAAAESIATGMLSALVEVHRQGLIHGDIKPSNVLLDSRAKPVLIDFGTARTSDDLKRTVTSAMYTPGYAPPELTARAQVKQAGPWSDLYSWAMVVWGLVARHPGLDGQPLDAASRIAVARSGGADPYTSQSSSFAEAGVPARWQQTLLACLALDPAARPHSGESIEAMISPSPAPASNARAKTVVESAPVPAEVAVPVAKPHNQSDLSRTDVSSRSSGAFSRRALFAGLAVAAALLAAVALAATRKANPDVSAPAPQGDEETMPTAVSVQPQPAAEMASPTRSPGAETATPERTPHGMVLIAPGSFIMGSPNNEVGREDDERQHRVTLTRAYWISTTEVSQSEYHSLMGTEPAGFGACGGSCPVERVSWFEAVAYANARSRFEGLPVCYNSRGGLSSGTAIYDCRGYRLPTEAEWEYAARAGTATATYAGNLSLTGVNFDPVLGAIAWYGGNSGIGYHGGADCSDWTERESHAILCGTHPVAAKRPNAWGLYDMLGNVWEWTHDGKADYPVSDSTNPSGDDFATRRVVRGCGWGRLAADCRAASRGSYEPTTARNFIGFRLARTAQ
jgi:formylglycine-generating enzyme required for sulfatase activity